MTSDALDPARLDDGDLIRLLDGEVHEEPAGELRPSERFRRLRAASERFDAMVAEIPVPDLPAPPSFERPAPRWGSRRVAAVVLFAAAAAVAVSPLGASIAREVRALAERIGLVEASAPPTTEPFAPPAGAALVSGVVTASSFTIEVRPAGAAGTLTLERVEGSMMTALAGAGSVAELIFSSDRLVIDGAGREEDLLVRIPATVREVVVRLGARELRTVELRAGAGPLVIPLAEG